VAVSVLLTAAEPSGDAIGGALLSALPGADWVGCGGPAMRADRRFRSLMPVESLGIAGLVEAVPGLRRALRARLLLRSACEGVAAAIFIDAPDLHLPLLVRCARMGLPAAQVVAPQVWAWRPGRIRALRSATTVVCLLPFEVELLRRHGVAACYAGHPAVDRTAGLQRSPGARIAVLPGSRSSEVRRNLLPMLRGVAHALRPGERAVAEVPLVVPAACPRTICGLSVEVTDRPGVVALAEASSAVVAMGTATLEAALLAVPTVAVGAVHPATAAIARRALLIQRFALPNVLLGEAVVEEVVQYEVERGVGTALQALRARPERAAAQAETIASRLRDMLGPSGFAARASAALQPMLASA
jgi:lipid-A-disaccharide synthase